MQLHRLRAHTQANEAADSSKSVSTGPDARNQPDWCRNSTSIHYFWTGEALGADSQQILMKILQIIILIYILSLSSSLWRPTQLYLKRRRGIEEHFSVQRLRPGQFSSGDFGLRSFRRPEISARGVFVGRRFRSEEFLSAGHFDLGRTLVPCQIQQSWALGRWKGGGGGRGEDKIWIKL